MAACAHWLLEHPTPGQVLRLTTEQPLSDATVKLSREYWLTMLCRVMPCCAFQVNNQSSTTVELVEMKLYQHLHLMAGIGSHNKHLDMVRAVSRCVFLSVVELPAHGCRAVLQVKNGSG
jgi:hypothetical protein